MERSWSALVVGGGIGGLTAALELRRAGAEVSVVERDTRLPEINTGFLLWGFAAKRLFELGLGPDLHRIREPVEAITTYSHKGDLVSDIPLAGFAREVGAPTFDVHRAALQALLADSVGQESIRLGAPCVAVDARAGAAFVTLDDGSELSADLIVGADGANSVVRGAVAGRVGLSRGEIGVWRGVALGTGGGMAIEDAGALGDCLRARN